MDGLNKELALLLKHLSFGVLGMLFSRSVCGSLTGFSYSILPALSLDGILDITIVNDAINGDIFIEFLRGLVGEMNSYPAKNSVLVMDNVKFHHDSRVADILEERYVVQILHFITTDLFVYLVGYDWFTFPLTVQTSIRLKNFFLASRPGFAETTPKYAAPWKATTPKRLWP